MMAQEHSDIDFSKLEFVYVGKSKPTMEDFVPIKNFDIKSSGNPSKPSGGLWASPVMENGKSDWENWLDEKESWTDKTNREMFNLKDKGSDRFYITPKKGCRILCIDEPEKYESYLRRNNGQPLVAYHSLLIDYEAIMKDYDAVYVPQREDDYSPAFQLWSAKTLLIGNLDAFNIQTEQEHSKQKASVQMQYMFANKWHR